jgi:hypothetical protein
MTDPLESILQQAGLKTSVFPSNSRYHGIETVKMETGNLETLVYIRRRFIPQPDRFSLLQEHILTQGERLDNITNRYIGDPEQFWRICDANGALHPDELTEIGSRIRITLPEGMPGYGDA